jgi:Zn-dependent protease with chaperone function
MTFLHYHMMVTLTFTYKANSPKWGESEKLRVDDMVSALAALDRLPFQPPKKSQEQMATLWIRVAMNQEIGIFHWLKHTHPPIHKRIEVLRRGLYLR